VRALLSTLTVLLASLAAVPAPAQASATTACQVAAHRGDHARWTENSLNAFKAAVADRANILEMDVQVTSDGRFVLMHDRSVDRTTRGSARWQIVNHTFAQVRALRLTDGQHVPTLDSVLAVARPSTANLFVELKWIPRSRWPSLVTLLRGLGTNRVVVNSFSRSVVLTFRADHPGIRTAVDLDRPVPVATAKTFGAVLVDHRHITSAWLRQMNAAHVPVYAWTVDTETLWKSYAGRIDVILTNRVPAYVAFRAKYCASLQPRPPTGRR
jgi:glycerophosphoryl diester phosphodiesterase